LIAQKDVACLPHGRKEYPFEPRRFVVKIPVMGPIRTVLIFISVVLLIGALLAPCLFWLVQSAAHSSSAFQGLAQQPFHRFVSRSLLIVAIVGLWPMARQLQIRSWRELGFWFSPEAKRQFGQGLLLGFFTLAIVAVLALTFGARRWNFGLSLSALGTKLLEAVAVALVVAVIEEVIFRGAIFGSLRKRHNWITALVLSSGIYAWFHFFRRPASPDIITWTSGFQVLAQMLRGFADLQSLVPGFFVLFLAGTILAMAVQRTNGLWFSIGTHAGWIVWLKIYGTLTVAVPAANGALWGTTKLTDGWLAGVVLLIAALLNRDIYRLPKYDTKPA
jgi:uncharacterized protein